MVKVAVTSMGTITKVNVKLAMIKGLFTWKILALGRS